MVTPFASMPAIVQSPMNFSLGSAATLELSAALELSVTAELSEAALDDALDELPESPQATSPKQHTQSIVANSAPRYFLMMTPFPKLKLLLAGP
jgi:hypothetical protein